MRIDKIRTLSGPNIYNHKPVLVMKLYLEALAETESRDVEGFNARLVAALPALASHQCSKGRPPRSADATCSFSTAASRASATSTAAPAAPRTQRPPRSRTRRRPAGAA